MELGQIEKWLKSSRGYDATLKYAAVWEGLWL